MLFLVALLVVGLTSLFFVWKKRRDAKALLEKPKTDEERRAEAQKLLATPPPRPSSVFSRGEEEESSLVKTKRKAKPSSKFHEDDFEEEEDVGYEPTEIVRLLKEDDDEAITETASHHPNWFERDIEVIRELELYLIRAIENDKIKVIEALINKKILLLDAVLEGTQNRKRGLVGWAASVQSPKVMEYLILRGSPIDLDGDDDTIFREAPTVIAASHGNANQLETLLRHGANPNYVDCRGESALQRACRLGDLRSCEALIKYEADVNRPNGNGTFAIERAASGPFPEVVETLLKAGSYCPLFAADPSAVDTVTNLIVDRMIEASRVAVSVHIPLSMISFVATAPLDVVKNINQKFSLRFYQLTQGSSSSRKSLIPFKSKKALRVEIADDLFSNVNVCDTETLVPDNLWIHNTGALKIECIVHRESNPGGLPFESTIPLESPPRLVLDKHSKSKITLCLSPKSDEVVETALMLEINGASAKLGKANHRWIHWVKVFPARQKSHKPRRVDQIVAQCELKK